MSNLRGTLGTQTQKTRFAERVYDFIPQTLVPDGSKVGLTPKVE